MPRHRPQSRRARPAALASLAGCALLALSSCGYDGAGSGVEAMTQPSIAAGSGSFGADAEMAPEASADETTSGDRGPQADPLVVPTPPDRVPQASFPDDVPSPHELPRTVAVVGDSLTLSAQDEIVEYLEALGIDVIAIDAAQNRRIADGTDPDPGIDIVERIGKVAEPELWVIALGTNDVGSSVGAAAYAADIAEIVDAIPDDAALVWVDAWIRDRQPAVEDANAVLRASLADRDDTAIADWFAHGDDRGLVTNDGVHLTDDGQFMFAATIASAIVDLFD